MGCRQSMDTRLVTLGVGVTIISVGFTIYGLITSNNSLAGVSLSTLVLGLTLATLGLTYSDPLSEALNNYSKLLSSALIKVYEDLGLINEVVMRTCFKDGVTYVIFSKSMLPCSDVSPGLGVVKGVPYIAFSLNNLTVEAEDLEAALTKFGIANAVSVKEEAGELVVELRGVRKDLISGGWRPLNPVQVLLPAYITSYLRKGVAVTKQEFVEGLYRVRLKVVEAEGAV